MTSGKRAPQSLPRPVRDLVAEGGNVLASDDAPVDVSIGGIAYVPRRRLHLGKSGRWIARVVKS